MAITRIRLGHCLLNKTRFLIGKHDPALCEEEASVVLRSNTNEYREK